MSRLELELPASAQAPARAREAMTTMSGIPEHALEDLILLVSEVVSNAVRHGSPNGSPIRLSATVGDGHVKVSVSDGGPGLHVVPSNIPGTPEGYGLRLLDDLADEWGWATRPVSEVWFRLRWS